MIGSVLRLAVTTAVIIACMLLPFLPGRYDPLAMPLSMMAQLIGTAGLVVVPLGALWLVAESRSPSGRTRRIAGVTALIATSLVWLLVSLAGFIGSLALGVATLALGAYGVRHVVRRLARPKSEVSRREIALPLSLLIVPAVVGLTRLVIADSVSEFSRSRAIRNAAPLIADIEAHRTAIGRYPASTLSVWPDYKPSVIGIKEYRYEPSGDSYNLAFENPAFPFGTREIVMYNPRGEQAMASHAMDVLQLTAAQLALDRQRGHYAVHEARQPNWKYFWFD